jgi:hypothetical protein
MSNIPDTMTLDEYALMNVTKPKRSKYGNTKVVIDGETFDSQAEAARWRELLIMEGKGLIWDLKPHPTFELIPAFTDRQGKRHRATFYEADAQYYENDEGRYLMVVEDTKGVETAVFKIKMKLLISIYEQRYPYFVFRIVK